LLDIHTDNRNRTGERIRHCFGKTAATWRRLVRLRICSTRRATSSSRKAAAKEDDLMNIVLEAGGEDLTTTARTGEILTAPSSYEAVP